MVSKSKLIQYLSLACIIFSNTSYAQNYSDDVYGRFGSLQLSQEAYVSALDGGGTGLIGGFEEPKIFEMPSVIFEIPSIIENNIPYNYIDCYNHDTGQWLVELCGERPSDAPTSLHIFELPTINWWEVERENYYQEILNGES